MKPIEMYRHGECVLVRYEVDATRPNSEPLIYDYQMVMGQQGRHVISGNVWLMNEFSLVYCEGCTVKYEPFSKEGIVHHNPIAIKNGFYKLGTMIEWDIDGDILNVRD